MIIHSSSFLLSVSHVSWLSSCPLGDIYITGIQERIPAFPAIESCIWSIARERGMGERTCPCIPKALSSTCHELSFANSLSLYNSISKSHFSLAFQIILVSKKLVNASGNIVMIWNFIYIFINFNTSQRTLSGVWVASIIISQYFWACSRSKFVLSILFSISSGFPSGFLS